MNGMRRFVAALCCLAMVCTISLSGCKHEITLPDYSDGPEMMIGGFHNPLPYIEDFQLAKDAGFTHMLVDSELIDGAFGSQAYMDALELCNQVGIKSIPQVLGQADDAGIWDGIDFRQTPSVVGLAHWDEPTMDTIPKIARFAEMHVEKYGEDLLFFVNLYPGYADSAALGGTFDNYVATYCAEVLEKIPAGRRLLSYDYYPILEISGQKILRSTWLADNETIMKYAKQYGAETHAYIQAVEHWGQFPVMSEAELRWQFAVYMAQGFRNFTYFTYCGTDDGEFGDALVSSEVSGVTYPTYDYAKTVNLELKAVEKAYLSFDYIGLMPVIGIYNETGNNANFAALKEPLESIPFIEKYATSQDTLMGQFKDKDGRDGLFVTNFSDPRAQLFDMVQIKFADAEQLVVYTKGERKVYVLKNGTFTYELEPGQGAFMIPLS